MIKAILKYALGYQQDRYYNERISNGFEWCKRWLEKHHPALELDDEALDALREITSRANP